MRIKSYIRNFNFGLFLLGLQLISCTTKENKPTEEIVPIIEAGRTYDRITKSNSSYSVYLPKNCVEKEKYPAIIFLDPHGHGKFPLEKYKSLADKFHFLLIGSNDSKNGMNIEQCIKFAGDLLNETSTTLPGFKQQISLVGFSGGAKVALVGANKIPGFSNAVYCGAAIPPGSIQVTVPLIAIAGNKDMNYTEVRKFNQSLDKSTSSHTIIEWNGKHEWPDTKTFSHAFYWIFFTAMRNKNILKDEIIIDSFKRMINEEINNEKNILIKELLMNEEIEMLKDISTITEMKSKLAILKNSVQFIEAEKKQNKILANEDQRKMEFAGAFESREIPWWKNQIQLLIDDKNNESNQRILGYISLASWSYSSKAVALNNTTFAQKVLQIYKLADPENSEQPFLSACLYSKNGMPDSAIYFLKEAIILGLDERNKIESANDLNVLRGRSDYQNLIEKMKCND